MENLGRHLGLQLFPGFSAEYLGRACLCDYGSFMHPVHSGRNRICSSGASGAAAWNDEKGLLGDLLAAALFLSAIYAVYPGRNVLVHRYGTLCHANVFFSVNDCLDAEVGADGKTPVSDFYASGRSVSGRVSLSAHHSGSSDSPERLALEPFDGKEPSAENVSSVDSDH